MPFDVSHCKEITILYVSDSFNFYVFFSIVLKKEIM